MKRAASWAIVYIGVVALLWILTQIDLLLNGWLRGVPFKWKMLLTTAHWATILWLNNQALWLLLAAVTAAVVVGLLWFRFRNSD